ncbi:slipin family protein, partial [bacterium]|nr:slipin family protein [bacterium]
MEIIANLQIYLGILIIVLLILSQAVKILREYERGVIFRLGRLVGAKGPGLILLIPIVDRIVRVSLRIITMDVPAQEVITKDTVPVKVNAVIYFRVVTPENAIVEIQNFVNATSQIAQTTLRSVLGQMELDEILSQREKINQTLQKIVDEHTGPWGIKVTAVETKDIELPEGMKRAMAKQAEAERERRAKIIHAEGEYQASENLVKAADRIA